MLLFNHSRIRRQTLSFAELVGITAIKYDNNHILLHYIYRKYEKAANLHSKIL